jgi:hypothetical protein
MRTMDLTDIFSDPAWKALPKAQCENLGALPNRVYYTDGGQAAIVVRRSRRGDFAISQRGFNYHVQAEKTGKRIKCYVLLVNEDSVVINQITVLSLERKLNGSKPFPGSEGLSPYWWVDDEFDLKEPNTDPMPY